MKKQYLSTKFAPDLKVMMLDFNSYFASVEQQLNPDLRSTPIGVVPLKAETTSCIAASYEAKAFGVKTGTKVRDARKMCPGIRFVVAKHAKYVKVHLKAVEIVNRFIPVDAVLSIDEMCANLSPRWQSETEATQLALNIKNALQVELGECMSTSIGFSSNRFLAKTASNLVKPNGLVLLREADLPQALYHLELESLTGIGSKMGARLRKHGIETVEALYQQNSKQLRAVWGGIGGELFWQQLHGIYSTHTSTETQSIGHSHVLPPAERNRDAASTVLDRLMQKAAMRLRKSTFLCSAVTVQVGFMKQHFLRTKPWVQSARINPTEDTAALLAVLHALLSEWMLNTKPQLPLSVGIVLHGLIPKTQVTLNMFDEPAAVEIAGKTNQMMDSLNRQFGKNTVYYASAHGAHSSAPMRIAFNRIPDLETES